MAHWSNDRVHLRRCCDEDWTLMWELLQDEPGYYWFQTIVEPPCTESDAETRWSEILSMHEEDGRLDLAICTPEDELAGMVSLSLRDEQNGIFTAPIFLLPEFRGEGYGRAAMELLLDYAFDERNLHKLQVSIVADNKASLALHRSLGCVKEGRFRAQLFHKGVWKDQIWLGLTEEEWRSNRT